MGTRNLTAVVLNGEYKIAQYGQWDGYPSGQGKTALQFLRSKKNQAALKKALSRVQFIEQAEIDKALNLVGAHDGWLTSEQSKRFDEMFPLLTRDHGAEILALVAASDKPMLQNGITFAEDSLFCEWAYVVDFDKNSFEVYKGFVRKPFGKKQRFYAATPNKGGYYPIKLAKRFDLGDLPTYKEFLEALKEKA